MARMILVAAAIAAGTALAPCARAQDQVVDCQAFGNAAARVAEYREAGAPMAGVLAYLHRLTPQDAVRAAIELEVRRVYAERLGIDEARTKAYARCLAVLGNFGKET